MAEHVFSLLCDRVLADLYSTDKFSLIDLVERLTLQVREEGQVERLVAEAQAHGDKGILISSNFILASGWTRSDPSVAEEARPRYGIINPAGERIHEEAFDIDLKEFVSQRIFIRIKDFPLASLGRHWLVVEKEKATPKSKNDPRWDLVARLPLEIVESPIPPP